jgi:MFS transporter, DHA3 family, macrolide efflux protein
MPTCATIAQQVDGAALGDGCNVAPVGLFRTALFHSKETTTQCVTVSVWRHPNFVRLWLGQMVSVIGDGIRTLALLLWAKESTGSNGAVGLIAAAGAAPLILAGPLGGSIADRFDRRLVMTYADTVRCAMSALLGIAFVFGRLSIPLACAAAAVSALGTAAFTPAYAASISMLVPEHLRVSANSLNVANSAVGGLLGPVVGSLVLTVAGTGAALAIDAASFAIAALLTLASRIPRPTSSGPAVRLAFRSGFDLLWANRRLRALSAMALTLNLALAPLTVLFVALGIDRLGGRSGTIAAIEVAASVGLFAGAALAPWLRRIPGLLFWSLMMIGVAVALLGVPRSVLIVCPLVAVVGIGGATATTSLTTWLQQIVSPDRQGRAFGTLGAVAGALQPAGLALAAPLVVALGVTGAFVACGTFIIVATAVWSRSAELWAPLVPAPPDITRTRTDRAV